MGEINLSLANLAALAQVEARWHGFKVGKNKVKRRTDRARDDVIDVQRLAGIRTTPHERRCASPESLHVFGVEAAQPLRLLRASTPRPTWRWAGTLAEWSR